MGPSCRDDNTRRRGGLLRCGTARQPPRPMRPWYKVHGSAVLRRGSSKAAPPTSPTEADLVVGACPLATDSRYLGVGVRDVGIYVFHIAVGALDLDIMVRDHGDRLS